MKKLFFSVLRGAGVVRLVSWWHREHTIFLCYHSVTNWPRLIPHEFKLHTSASLFTKHLDYLQRHYRVIPLSEYIENDSDLKTQAIFSQEEKSVSARRRNQRPRRARYQFA